ncbi:uncharacterized protein METZ01_LOCUS397065 [marine metagenome]|uniref:Uncharacterized protein n=1 Tax=marine metagenome TaxID=408172 RepID=A0A382VEB5_9ZZZZ
MTWVGATISYAVSVIKNYRCLHLAGLAEEIILGQNVENVIMN